MTEQNCIFQAEKLISNLLLSFANIHLIEFATLQNLATYEPTYAHN